MLTEKTVYDQITILEDGQIQLRRSRVILDDGTELNRVYYREVIVPGQDVSGYPARVQDVAAVVWTPEVVAEFEAASKAKSEAMLASLKEQI